MPSWKSGARFGKPASEREFSSGVGLQLERILSVLPTVPSSSVCDGPLSGMLVVEFAHGLAGPFASAMLSDFGAEVIKIERPGLGDFMRQVDPSGGSWWRSIARNKQSIAIELSDELGREIVRDLIARADVFIESFRPGVLERLGYGPDVLLNWNANLIILRISGYGQTGPYRDRPGFGKAAEAFGGLVHMTGFPDESPLFTGFPVSDMCSGLLGAYGVLLAWIAREKKIANGQVIDLALYETVLRIMDYLVPITTGTSMSLSRNGNRQPMSFAPAGIHKSKDQRWVIYSAPSPQIVKRVLTVVASAKIASQPRFDSLDSIRCHTDEIDRLIGKWVAKRTAEEAAQALTSAEAVASIVLTPGEVVSDPHVTARRSITSVEGDNAKYVSPTPKLSATPGRNPAAGSMAVGDGGMAVLRNVLRYDELKIRKILESNAVQLPPSS